MLIYDLKQDIHEYNDENGFDPENLSVHVRKDDPVTDVYLSIETGLSTKIVLRLTNKEFNGFCTLLSKVKEELIGMDYLDY
jgi:hypothetical protein